MRRSQLLPVNLLHPGLLSVGPVRDPAPAWAPQEITASSGAAPAPSWAPPQPRVCLCPLSTSMGCRAKGTSARARGTSCPSCALPRALQSCSFPSQLSLLSQAAVCPCTAAGPQSQICPPQPWPCWTQGSLWQLLTEPTPATKTFPPKTNTASNVFSAFSLWKKRCIFRGIQLLQDPKLVHLIYMDT